MLFQCNQCDNQFLWCINLEFHQRMHKEEKPFFSKNVWCKFKKIRNFSQTLIQILLISDVFSTICIWYLTALILLENIMEKLHCVPGMTQSIGGWGRGGVWAGEVNGKRIHEHHGFQFVILDLLASYHIIKNLLI